MIISPEAYIDRFKGTEYLDLITERDRLMRFIKEDEEKDIAGDRSGKEWDIHNLAQETRDSVMRGMRLFCLLINCFDIL